MTFLLIHGAWHGAWCWKRLVDTLAGLGHDAVAIDLPGAEPGGKPGWGISLADYARTINETAEAIEGDVHLVGHSLGGLSISTAAEQRPDLYASLTYVAAFMLKDQSLLDVVMKGYEAPLLNEATKIPNLFRGYGEIKPRAAPAAFYNNCAKNDADNASEQLCPQSSRPTFTKVRVTDERWGSIPRYYVHCTQDNALPLANQKAFVATLPCAGTVELDTDHSPFLSTPRQLAEALIQLS